MSSSHEDRPWGSFDVLIDDPHTKVKRLTVNPGQRLSLQSHKLRDEHWVVVAGKAEVTLDDAILELSYGQHVYVRRGAKHRIRCLGDSQLEIVEVQVGDGFPEEDITRYSDDYHRAD